MHISVLGILTIIGALGFFMFGMKVMSEAIQKIAGARMRLVMASLTSSRARGILSGFSITALIQSSSATTVLLVGFVNAGLLTVTESISITMGANIGTSITAWLVSIFGFSFNIGQLTIPIIGIGFLMTISNRGKIKSWGEFIIGFAILFIGLVELKNAMPNLSKNPEVLAFLSNYTGYGIFSILLFVLIGMIFTAIVQSSSASMVFTLVLANEGLIDFQLAAAMVLGENIGTTITANLAALIGNVYAKRAALAHFLFNLIGVTWMILVFSVFLRMVDVVLQKFYGFTPIENFHPENAPIALSIFHTGFNVVNTLILVWFIPGIVKLTEMLIPAHGKEKFKLEHISGHIVPTSEIQIIEAKKEMLVSANILTKMSELLNEMIKDPKTRAWQDNQRKIKKYEEVTNRIEAEVANFLTKISEGNISKNASKEIRAILRINSDLENIADIYLKMSTIIQQAKEASIVFDKVQIDNLVEILHLTDQAHQIMEHNLMSDNGQFDYEKAVQKEREIDAKRNEIRRDYIKLIGEGKYNVKNGMFYNDLFASCEKVGDHLFNVSQSIAEELHDKD